MGFRRSSTTVEDIASDLKPMVRQAEKTFGVEVFSDQNAIAINHARINHLNSLGLDLNNKTVLDAGCGVGHLAQYFTSLNCSVLGLDARPENVAEAKKLYPNLNTAVANIELDPVEQFGHFQIVFSYGLLYHLENPISSLKKLSALCTELLLLETVICDASNPICELVTEDCSTPNQSITGLALRPSPSFIVAVLASCGFTYISTSVIPPNHKDFCFEFKNDYLSSRNDNLLRMIFIASRTILNNSQLVPLYVA